MEKENIYAKSWRLLGQWTLAATAAYITTLFLTGVIYGASKNENTVAIGLILATIFYVGLLIKAYIEYAQAYPWLKPGFWPKFWAATLGMFRVGYDRPGLKNLPWKVLLTWTLASAAINVNTLQLFMADPAAGLMLIAILPFILVAVVVVAYAIGYIFGGKSQGGDQ